MTDWIQQVTQAPTTGAAAIPAALLLGVVGSAGSCCNVVVVGAVAGYSGSLGQRQDRREVLWAGLSFMIGTIVALVALGLVFGVVGRVAGATLGSYWRLAAGLIVVFFGLASFDLLPFKMPRLGLNGAGGGRRGVLASLLYGLAVGGGSTACSASCNPVLPVALAFATFHGASALGVGILTAFALGYSLPLTGVLVGLGLGLGKLTAVAKKVTPALRVVTGGAMVGIGFYLLATIT
jgi:cytochrome c biogenesis protein CcdA